MASGNPNPNRTPMYPQVQQFDDSTSSTTTSSSYSYSSLYPTIDPKDLIYSNAPSAPPPPQSIQQESLITIPGAILHLIDQNYSVELANGDLRVIRLIHDHHTTLAALATVSNDVQWPLTKDLTAVKLDTYHYFFSFQPPQEDEKDESFDEQCCKKSNDNHHHEDVLSYGLTILAKGQDIHLLNELDAILETYTTFSMRNVEVMTEAAAAAVSQVTVGEFKMDNNKKKKVEGQCAAYWTTLAPNVEEYSSTAARLIATGSGHLVKGILWCGDVTIDRLNWGNEVLKDRMASGSGGENNTSVEIHPTTLKRIKRVKRVTKMTEKVATGVLSGVVKVSGLFTGSVANSKVGKKFFSLLPGELVLASLDGFSKICDAVEVAGKNVMSTSSTATTGLVSQRYGEEAGKATSEGLGAAGHAIGTAWTVFKIRKALNPKSFMKPTTLAKSAAKAAAAEQKAKASK